MLDYNRNIFTQADIDSFSSSSLQIDDQLKAGNNQLLSMFIIFLCEAFWTFSVYAVFARHWD